MTRRSMIGSTLLTLLVACAAPPQRAPRPPPPPIASVAPPPALSAPSSAAVVPEPPKEDPVASFTDDEGVGVAPGPAGHLGAWLALGPFRLDDKKPPQTTTTWAPPSEGSALDDHALRPSYGAAVPTRVDVADKKGAWTTAPAKWSLASSGEGAIDLEKLFGSRGKPAVGYLGGVLRVPKRAQLILLVGSDDGCEVIVDGKSVFSRDASRPQRDDDDAIPLDLDVGDHVVLFKLHQRDGGWAFRARLVDRAFAPPYGVRLLLPGADASVAGTLARAMSWVKIVREPTATGYALAALVRYPEGAPLRPPIEVSATVLAGKKELVAPTTLGAVVIEKSHVTELRAPIGAVEADDQTMTIRIDVAGRVVDGTLAARRVVRLAIVRARSYLEKNGVTTDVAATIDHLASRLAQQVNRGDLDTTAQVADAKFLDAFVADAEKGLDPIARRSGPMRLAHIARADDRPQPIGVYVPKNPGNKVPLYVGLHGMNGGPMSMLRVFFGGDDDKKPMSELERTMGPAPPIDAFVIAPHAHGNAMYRQLGEEEVLDAVAWARKRFPQIDPDRVYLTGFSMGGIGAASIPLHHPDVFAAAQPLCGYHSYFIRRDVAGRPRRPWEQYLLEDRSNVMWADNGERLPLFIVHGLKDLPIENSKVLIDAYEKRGFSVKYEHPDLGHDVWGYAYENMQQLSWFAGKRRVPHPKHIRFRTTRPRFGDDAWVHIDRMAGVAEWATIDADAIDMGKITIKTKGVDAFHLDRDPLRLGEGAVTLTVDGAKLTYAAGAPVLAHREGGQWTTGAPPSGPPRKEGRITGPIRDVWNDPVVLVYGTEDPLQTRVNLEVARALATIRYGVDVSYPIIEDSKYDLDAPPAKATILIGNARSNRVVRALEPSLPIKVTPASAGSNGSITFAGRTFTGNQLGAAFVVPNPRAPSQYLLVVEGVDALGTFRALSLPELLPDFVVWDERIAPARGQSLLAFGSVLAAGFFDNDWQPPKTFDDPLLAVPSAKSEKDATPYLP